MDLHQAIDDRIKDTIETMLDLPSLDQSNDTRMQTFVDDLSCIRRECSSLRSQLCDKEELISRAKAEAAMNAQALRKFVKANQNMADECAELLEQRKKLELECLLYDKDRETLMDLANEAEERATDAEARVQELEGEVVRLSGELLLQKHDDVHERECVNKSEKKSYTVIALHCSFRSREICTGMYPVLFPNGANVNGIVLLEDDELVKTRMPEDELLESVVTPLIDIGEAASASAFFEAHCPQVTCEELHQMWDVLRPSTRGVLALAAKLKKLEKDQEIGIINLRKAENENGALLEENKRWILQYQREISLSRSTSGGASTRVRLQNEV